MRAGSLSDPRVVALLRRHFVCVHVPMLATAFLIEDPEDRAFLEALNRKHNTAYGGRGDGPLYGGEREVFLAPDGTLIRIGMTLHAGGRENEQSIRRVRAAPEHAVRQFFGYAEEALRKVRGDLPEDFEALRTGDDPEVARLRVLAPPPAPDGTLRIWVRNDRLMYEALVGESRIDVDAGECARIAAEGPWPRELFVRLARECYPRGDVFIDLRPESVEGGIETHDVKVEDGVARGRFRGRLRLAPRTDVERGRRAASFLWAETRLEGDFAFDRTARRFTSFRLAGFDGAANSQAFARRMGLDADALPARATAAEHRNVSPEQYGSRQPYGVAVELVERS